ncbi:MAG: GNAT family N-acetyltransferase [bacterium]
MKIVLETDRTILRPWRSSDLEEYYKIISNPLVLKYLPIDSITVEETEAKLQSRMDQHDLNGFCLWAVILKADKSIIGHCGLQYIYNTQDIELGYALSPAFWNKGLATETAKASLEYAFKTLKLKTILGLVNKDNAGSKHVLEKIGMKYVGVTDKYYDIKDLLLYKAT